MANPKKKKTKRTTGPRLKKTVDHSLPAWLTNRKLHCWLLFALSMLIYANSLTNDYAQDDAIVITDNMFTQEGVSGIPGILQYDTFYGFFKEEGKANLVSGGRYRPLTLVMFAIEVQLFGLNPFVSHLINILLYGLTVVVFYLLLLQLFRPDKDPARAYFIALSAALLFTTHPIHTEVVANIKGRDEIVALLGSLAALWLAVRAYFHKKPMLLIGAGIIFFLGLMSKENAITFLAIVPLTFFFFTKAKPEKILLYTAPFLVAAAAFLAIRFSILGTSLGDPSLELMNNPFLKIEGGRWVHLAFGEKMAMVMFTLGKYLQLLFFPIELSHDYYPRQIGLHSWAEWQVLLSLVIYLGLVGYAAVKLGKKDPVSFAIWLFLIPLSLVSNIVFPVGVPMAERLIFMSSTGFALAIALLLYRLMIKGNKKVVPALMVVGAISLLFSTRTILRNPVWENNFTLFTTDIEHSPNSAKLRNAIGGELLHQSVKENNPSQQESMRKEAAGHLQEAIKIHPTYKNAYLLLGNAYNYLKQFEASIQAYQKALEIDPDYEEATTNLGITYRDAGRYFGEQKGDLNKAMTYLNKAYEMRPDEYETVRLLGVAYGVSGNDQKAIEFFTKAVELEPDNADANFNLGSAYMNAGMEEQGNAYIQKALQLDPEVMTKRQNNQGNN